MTFLAELKHAKKEQEKERIRQFEKRNREKQDAIKQRKIKRKFRRNERNAINTYLKAHVNSVEVKKKKIIEDEKDFKKKLKKKEKL
jgi:hypothetical protein